LVDKGYYGVAPGGAQAIACSSSGDRATPMASFNLKILVVAGAVLVVLALVMALFDAVT
jgi:hypothetical protein